MRHGPSTDEREDHDSRSRVVRLCAELADSSAFNLFIFGVILANAFVLGAETYPPPSATRAECCGRSTTCSWRSSSSSS